MGACSSSPGAAAPSGPPVKVVKAPSPSRSRTNNNDHASRARKRSRRQQQQAEHTSAAASRGTDPYGMPKRRKSVRFDEEDGSSAADPEQYRRQPLQSDNGSPMDGTALSEIELARKRISQLCQQQGKSGKAPPLPTKQTYNRNVKTNSGPGREHVRYLLMMRGRHGGGGGSSSISTSSVSNGSLPREVMMTTDDKVYDDYDDSYATYAQSKVAQQPENAADKDKVEEFDEFYTWKRNRVQSRQRKQEKAQAYDEFVSWERNNTQQRHSAVDPETFDELISWQRSQPSRNNVQSLEEFVTWQRENGRAQPFSAKLTESEFSEVIDWQRVHPNTADRYDEFVTWQRTSQHYRPDISPELFHQILETGPSDEPPIDDTVALDEFEEVVRWQRSLLKASMPNEQASYGEFVDWQRTDPAAKTVGVLKVEPAVFDEIVSWQRSQTIDRATDVHDFAQFAERNLPDDETSRVLSWQRNRKKATKTQPTSREPEPPNDFDAYLEFKQSTLTAPESTDQDLTPDFVDAYVQWKRNKQRQTSLSTSEGGEQQTLPSSDGSDDLEIFVEWKRASKKLRRDATGDAKAGSKGDGGDDDDLLQYITWRHNRSKSKTTSGEGSEPAFVQEQDKIEDAENELLSYVSWQRARPKTNRHVSAISNTVPTATAGVSAELVEYVQWKRSERHTARSLPSNPVDDEKKDDALRYVLWQRNRSTQMLPPEQDPLRNSTEEKSSADDELLEYVTWQRSREKPSFTESGTINLAPVDDDSLTSYLSWKRSRNSARDSGLKPDEHMTAAEADTLKEDVEAYVVWKCSVDHHDRSDPSADKLVVRDDDAIGWLHESLSSSRKRKKKPSGNSVAGDASTTSLSTSEVFGSMVSYEDSGSIMSSLAFDGDSMDDSTVHESSMKRQTEKKKKKEQRQGDLPTAYADGEAAAWLSNSLTSLSKKRRRRTNTKSADLQQNSLLHPLESSSTAPELDTASSNVENAQYAKDSPTIPTQNKGGSQVDVTESAPSLGEAVVNKIDLAGGDPPSEPAAIITKKKKSKSITGNDDLEGSALSKGTKKKRASSKVGDGPSIPVPKRWSMPVRKETVKDKFFRLLNLEHRTEAETKEIQDMIMSNPELCQESFSFDGIKDGINPLSRLCIIHAPLEAIMMCYMAHPSAIKQFDLVGTPLHYAAKYATPTDVISFLISKRQLMVQTLNMERLAPLHYACMSKAAPESIHLLLEHYPSAVQLQDKHGMSPLHLACANGSELGTIEQLVHAFPAACTTENTEGQTPLHLALENGASFDIIEALVVGKFDAVKVADDNGNLPLHIAAMTPASEETVQLLVDHFKDGRKSKNRAKQSPLDLAQIHRPEDSTILELLTIKAVKKKTKKK